jgi:Tfp pilus assembly protein PilX
MRRIERQQRGIATLTLTFAILLLGTFVVFGLAQAVLMEQKIANNGTRAAHAFEAAEAGLHAALDYLADDPDRDNDGNIDPVFDTNGDGVGDADMSRIGSGSMTVTTQDLADGAMTRIVVTAQGYSDDRSARRTLTQTVVTLDPLPHPPRVPVMVSGALHGHGSAAVHNPQGHDAIWSGGSVQVDTSSAAIIAHDDTLGSLTADELFHHVFSTAPGSFAATLVTRETTPQAFERDAQLATRDVIRVDGTTTLGGLTLGCRIALAGSTPCPEAARRPVLVVITGDATVAANTHLYGLLFVGGTLRVTGALQVHGAVIVAGDIIVGSGAELEAAFDSSALAELHKAGPMVPLAGTWQER